MSTMRSIFWFDPGLHTGVAWGTFNLKANTVADAMRDRVYSGSATIMPFSEPKKLNQLAEIDYQAREIWKLWSVFKNNAVRKQCMDPDWVIIGAENFILKPGMHTPGIEGIMPAFIIGAFQGYRLGLYESHHPRANRHIAPLNLQSASVGMRYNKRQMLESWGCWVKGREHERAAFAHIGAYLMSAMPNS